MSVIRLLLPASLAFLCPAVLPQGGAPRVDREQMWFAPTAEDWARPCLITWQRTWEDALAVSRETGKPILICVNMDGEIASEHYAGVRYRQPEIAQLYQPYVCVIASVYRHNPRDHDEQGRRIPCPRFGTVTCGEHIAIEPLLFDRFFKGTRVAPRHIMVELDGKETYDVYYAWDTDSVFAAIQGGISGRAFAPKPLVRGDRSLVERVASRDILDRIAVETAYQQGDQALRRSLLQAAVQKPEAAPLGLLRLGVFGLDLELGKLARRGLAQADSEGAIDLITEALRVPMEAGERDALIAALERFGSTSWRARTAAVIHRGLSARSGALDVESWSKRLGGASYQPPPRDPAALGSLLDQKEELSEKNPKDWAAQLEVAEAALALAVSPETARSLSADRRNGARFAAAMFEDVLEQAQKAEKRGASGWRVDAVVALASHYLGRHEAAHQRAERAVRTLAEGAESWNAMAVLALFAATRQDAILKAVREKKEWPPQWLADVHATYSVLARHPLCTDEQVVAHYDFLVSLGAFGPAKAALEEGLKRFPESWGLHERLRGSVLWARGVNGLEAAYEALLRREPPTPNLPWFAGLASFVAAEAHRRAGDFPRARAAYDRALALYDRNIQERPESKDSSDHYAALALAGRARLALETGEHEAALGDLLASFRRKPHAASSLDGLGFSPVMTAETLYARLVELKRTDLADRLQKALAELGRIDPALLAPQPYETQGPEPAGGTERRPARRREG